MRGSRKLTMCRVDPGGRQISGKAFNLEFPKVRRGTNEMSPINPLHILKWKGFFNLSHVLHEYSDSSTRSFIIRNHREPGSRCTTTTIQRWPFEW